MFYYIFYEALYRKYASQIPLLKALNVFQYQTFRTAYAAITALALSLIFGPLVIRKLTEFKFGQEIREEGPASHQAKRGAPTMGGVMIIGSVFISTLLWADLKSPGVWVALSGMVGCGAIGFADDYLKFIKARSKGLSPTQKFSAQIGVALLIALALYFLPSYSTKLNVPFFKNFTPDLGWFYVIFVVLFIVGSSNAVNLTDGLDGLAIGPIMIAALAYTIVAYVAGHRIMSDYLLIPHIEGAGEIAVFTAAILGSSLGFLWFNTYPASVFMGDVGSLPLGAALGMERSEALVQRHVERYRERRGRAALRAELGERAWRGAADRPGEAWRETWAEAFSAYWSDPTTIGRETRKLVERVLSDLFPDRR